MCIRDRDGREFVFVPGDTVTLGWEQFAEGLNQEIAPAILLGLLQVLRKQAGMDGVQRDQNRDRCV